ncbi:MAG TPA: tetratricopeptide repeat protein [Ktedonobacteraceae bacterium]|nr:tetratricopeptide repeat protein [Ktedonobacteraceae bacterium]
MSIKETGPQPQPRLRLAEARLSRDWSQQEVAQRIGTNYVNVSRWERGVTKPTPYFRRKLCHLFGMTEQELDLEGTLTVPTEDNLYKTGKADTHPEQPPVASAPSGLLLASTSRPIYDPAIPAKPVIRLVGRNPELFLLRQYLLESDSVALTALNGLPGVGKTALSIALAHDPQLREHFHDGILWVGLGPNPDIPVLLSHWATLLGLSTAEIAALDSDQAWAKALHTAIGSRKMLLVIDDAWEIEHALTFKVGGPNCAHLVSTRFPAIATEIAHNRATVIKELNANEGIKLLNTLAPGIVEQEEQMATDLVQAVGGLPLALTLMGNYLRKQAHSGQSRRIRNALQQLTRAEVRLQISEQRSPIERHTSLSREKPLSLQSIIAVTDTQLSREARAALYALAVFPPKPNTFSEEAALAVTAVTPEALDTLSDAGLLESSGQARYTLHQVIADYARIQLQASLDMQPYARLIDYAIDFVGTHKTDYELLEQESPIILAAIDAAHDINRPEELIQAVIAFAPFLLLRGSYQLAEKHLQRARDAAVTLNDTSGVTGALLYLGEIALKLGNYPQAENLFQQGLALARQSNNNELLCALLTDLGGVKWNRGEYSQAEIYLQEGLALARQLGSIKQMSGLLKALGLVAASRGDYKQEEAYLQEGLDYARQIGDREQTCVLLMNLGATTGEQGNHAQAEVYFQEGLGLARQIGHQEKISALLSNLGGVAIEQGHYIQAHKYLQEGLRLARQAGNREWISLTLNNLGLTTRKQGDYVQTLAYLQEGLEVAKQIGTPMIIANILYELGNFYLDKQQIESAYDIFSEMQDTIHEGDQELVALSQYGLARVAFAKNNIEEARRLGAMSLESLEGMGNKNTNEVRDWVNANEV